MTTQVAAQPTTRRAIGVDLAMVSVAMVWGINASVVKGSLVGWDPLAYNAVRFAAAALLIFGYVVATDKQWRLPWQDLWRVAILGLVGNGLYQWLFIEAITRSTASNTALIISLSPVAVTIWGSLNGLDRVTAWLVGGTGLSVVGVGMVIWGEKGGFHFGGATLTGDLICLGSTLCWAAYTVYARPVIQRVGSSLRVTAWAMLFGAFTNLALGIPGMLRQDFSAITSASVLGMTFSCLMALVFSYIIYAWAVQRVGGARTALFINLTPLFAAVVAGLFLGERWAAWQWMGALLVLAGMTLAKLEHRKT